MPALSPALPHAMQAVWPSSATRAPKRALITCTCAPHLEDYTASLGARFGGEVRELGPAEWITTRDNAAKKRLLTKRLPYREYRAPMLADSARRPADSARRAAGFTRSHSNAEEAGQLMRSGPRMPGEVVLLVPGFNSFRSPVAQKRSGDGEAKYLYGTSFLSLLCLIPHFPILSLAPSSYLLPLHPAVPGRASRRPSHPSSTLPPPHPPPSPPTPTHTPTHSSMHAHPTDPPRTAGTRRPARC
jgi:hypothetical protein